MNRFLLLAPRACGQSVRTFANSSIRQTENRVDLTKVKQDQKKFQIDNGVPVYIKGGLMDYILLGATSGLCVIGLGMVVKMIYDMARPPSAD